jgi:alpha-L-rhamnosidase
MVVNVEVPANTTSTIRLPKAKLDDVKENGKSLDNSEGITDILQDGEAVVILVGSGRYSFEYPW